MNDRIDQGLRVHGAGIMVEPPLAGCRDSTAAEGGQDIWQMNTPDSSLSVWLRLIDWLQALDARLPSEWPAELPPEESVGFWFRASELEMSTRDELSAKLRALASGKESQPMTLLEAWFCRRRIEWAGQVALSKAADRVELQDPLEDVVVWALVTTWESDGCIALWNHAERGGAPHPDNPQGLTPL